MFRRNFIQLITLAGAAGLTNSPSVAASHVTTVSYRVKGFTCVTCAVGLDTLLKQQKGVKQSKSTYPEGVVTITFDPALITESSLKDAIAELGFNVV